MSDAIEPAIPGTSYAAAALILVHIYFGVRPEKQPITKSMIFGWMSREFYLEEHDPKRWVVSPADAAPALEGSKRTK